MRGNPRASVVNNICSLKTIEVVQIREALVGKEKLNSLKISLTRGWSAWFTKRRGLSTKTSSLINSIGRVDHQRLNGKGLTIEEKQWIVGLTDSDGTFAIDRQVKETGYVKWNLVYKAKKLYYENIKSLRKIIRCRKYK